VDAIATARPRQILLSACISIQKVREIELVRQHRPQFRMPSP
jgi:hypothetical protein